MNVSCDLLQTIRDYTALFSHRLWQATKSGFRYGNDPRNKLESSIWKHPDWPRFKNQAKQVRSKMKALSTVFFDRRGVVHHEYTQHGQTVNQECYMNVLQRLLLCEENDPTREPLVAGNCNTTTLQITLLKFSKFPGQTRHRAISAYLFIWISSPEFFFYTKLKSQTEKLDLMTSKI